MIEPFPFVIKGAGKEKISEGRSGRGRSPGKTKRPGGPQRTKKGPQTLTGRIWDIRHISCLKKRCDLSVSAGTLSIAQFVRSYNPISENFSKIFRIAGRNLFRLSAVRRFRKFLAFKYTIKKTARCLRMQDKMFVSECRQFALLSIKMLAILKYLYYNVGKSSLNGIFNECF